ncbi:hypothetical protein TRFO_06347 [Tritrichomonas foetus]|uniref:Uncharacterized protein n=1 Tax=Tritrichomonas foetus TaxID=1144522 RepID=A0A1J4K3W4_9EUKA|nr:hypothetical protein TRFO_06347 [Tritrichomonas foetus]|eukprot:OHT04444.1 hypothetical protein TRFO_06347 [Tritrichomonas foetus]
MSDIFQDESYNASHIYFENKYEMTSKFFNKNSSPKVIGPDIMKFFENKLFDEASQILNYATNLQTNIKNKRSKNKKEKDITLKDVISSLPPLSLIEFYFKTLFSIELRSAIFAIFIIFLLNFTSQLGNDVPSRFDSTSCNYSLPTGFFAKNNIFMSEFNFLDYHKKFSIYFKFAKLKGNPNSFSFEPSAVGVNYTISSLNNTILVGSTEPENLFIHEFIGETHPVLIANAIFPEKYKNLEIETTIDGDLSEYGTFNLEVITNNSDYNYLLYSYRLLFTFFGIFLLFNKYVHFVEGENMYIPGLLIILNNIPTVLFDTETSNLAFSIQKLIDDLFSISVVNYWIYLITNDSQEPNNSFLKRIQAPMILSIYVASLNALSGSIFKSVTEFRNPYEYLHSKPGSDGYYILVFYVLLFFVSYIMHICINKSAWLNLENFIFFAAQLCHIFDEILNHWKIMKCISMGKWMRLFFETLSLFLLFKSEPESESSEEIMKEVPLTFDLDSSSTRSN